MKSLSILKYSIPASALLFCWLTMGVSATYDGGTLTTYGFPLNWYTPIIATSGGHQIALGRLVVDLGTYFVLVHLAWSKLKTPVAIPVIGRRAFNILLSLAAALSLLFSTVVFSTSPHFTWWKLSSPDPNAKSTHFISAGLQPQPPQ